MSRRGLVLAAVAWLAVVAMTSVVTWAVINDAGQRVLSESSPAVQLPGSDAATAPSSPAVPSRRPRHSRPSSPSAAPRTSVPSSAPTLPSPSPSSTTLSPALTSGTTGRSATWQGRPGSVTVRCAAGRASLESASPDDGYRVTVGGRGPGEVEVTLQGGGSKVQVTAGCASGAPRFRTETEGSDD
jgi:hypothetical protein